MPSTNCFLNELVTLNEVAKKLGINFKTALMHLTVTRKGVRYKNSGRTHLFWGKRLENRRYA